MLYKTTRKKPEVGKTIAFFYKEEWHLGSLIDDKNCEDCKKWEWYSSSRKEEITCIFEVVIFWVDLPEIIEFE